MIEKIQPEETTTPQIPPKRKFPPKILAVILGIFLAGSLWGVFFGVLPIKKLQKDGLDFAKEAQGIYQGIQNQNLAEMVAKINSSKEKYNLVKADYRKLVWLKYLPFVSSFYKDGEHLLKAGDYFL